MFLKLVHQLTWILFFGVYLHTHTPESLEPTTNTPPPLFPLLLHALLLQGEEVWFELELIGTLFD